ncbi:hypothetical protein Scep_001616 [Stephania cephalantha]|uniref:Hexosyltransferase n=1 Tax=Stephania cephalantha TaxID=152367 RepID=A0AAP0LB53_9MAGN
MKAMLEESGRPVAEKRTTTTTTTNRESPSFLNQLGSTGNKRIKIGMVNMEDEDTSVWEAMGETIVVPFKRVSEIFEWKDLFPEWIDEEEENASPVCPEIPMPDFSIYKDTMDLVVAKLPCKQPQQGWTRDVFRLQVHLITANLMAKKSKKDNKGRAKVVFLSTCRPMLELFRCNDIVKNEGDWWWYKPEISRLQQKVSLPFGSCQLSMPLWGKGIDEVYDLSKLKKQAEPPNKREAYATVLHSSETYVCGAIALAHSLLKTGTNRDLIILLDDSISQPKRDALAKSGWKIRSITRIRNPNAEKNTYNEYNYSKFRLWQLTDYDKIIFIDADIIVLRNLDILFSFPEISATGNDIWIFNSGIMSIEPSNCTFKTLMKLRKEIRSYNGGDQGFLNEIFVWWHRLPRRVNFLKNFWANTTVEAGIKNEMFGADPPKVYAIHYLGLKPWNCYRDYDCNWDVEDQRVYASDVAHGRWWRLHDEMGDKELQRWCGLTKQRRIELDWDRRIARKNGFPDRHWGINVTDPRRKRPVD